MQDFIKNNLYKRSMISYALYPLSLLNWLIVKFRRQFLASSRLAVKDIKLICVGNITSGGTGKTPFVIYLAKYLEGKGKRIAVISRGYKGSFENNNKIIADSNGLKDIAKEAGDEPYLIASRLQGTTVVVGKNRKKSLQLLLERDDKPDIIIFDDAYQHLKIKYDYSFVVFNGESPIGNGFLLPAGILREPLAHIKYADYIVFNAYTKAPDYLKIYHKPIINVSYRLTNLKNNNEIDIADKKLALLSAIGVPASFEKTIINAGYEFSKHFVFPDHYGFNDIKELNRIELCLKKEAIDFLICTEKDNVKLDRIDHKLPLLVACSEFTTDSQGETILNEFYDQLTCQKGV
ncbi:MAG: tetraacyldisaccharide 4'-kinase [Candidatus Cloacimonadales bacterium]|nr:tetraacyldisaccharide 4'-kinase [Candidatus Cloacimonadales bacterium]